MNILKILTKKRITGNLGEDAAVRALKRKKYRILERNYVASGHEIDIIAENRELVAFVEVKTRSKESLSPKEPRPASSVTPEKQRAIIAAARYYIGKKRLEKPVRLDVVEVFLKDGKVEEINHIENAFNYNSAYRR